MMKTLISNALGALAVASMLAGCGGSQSAISGSIAPLGPAAEKGCRGTGQVKIDPCPIVIHKRKGVRIKVSGPGVVQAYLGYGCSDGICFVHGGGKLKFSVRPGANCGGPAEIAMVGYNDENEEVGEGYASVTNHYCP